jgi:hypothetical protein
MFESETRQKTLAEESLLFYNYQHMLPSLKGFEIAAQLAILSGMPNTIPFVNVVSVLEPA